MRTEILNINELTESREMLKAREPNFMAFFIYLLLVLIAAVFFWMWYGELDITVRADGVLRPGQKVSLVRNINGGKVKEINYSEGKRVKRGEVLLRIESPTLELEKSGLLEERGDLMLDLELLDRLEKCLLAEENLFNPLEPEFFNRYLVYQYRLEQLKLELTRAEERYLREKSLPAAATTSARLKELEGEFLIARLSLDRYKCEFLINLKSEKKEKKERLDEVENQLNELSMREKLNNLEAPIGGVVQLIQEYNTGDYIPAGVEVLRIIPERGSGYKMELLVKNKDISQLKVGQQINYRFLALPSKEYGTLVGRIDKISSDAVTDGAAGMVYRVEASINGSRLYDKAGRPAEIKIGMVCEARVIVRKKKILYFVLEKLNFIS